MLTKIDLCSMALLKIGEEPIQSWLDDTATAKLCRTLFDTIINGLLTAHPWRFACTEYTIVPNSDGEFLLPQTCLRMLRCRYPIMGGRVVATGQTPIKVFGIAQTAPESFPSYFVTLAVTKLAMEFCIPLTGDQTVFRMLTALYESEIQSAKFIDGASSAAPGIEQFSLIDARF